MMKGGMCKCPHHKVVPLLVVLFALAFFLKAMGVLSAGFVDLAWPVLVGLAGLMKLSKGMCKCNSSHMCGPDGCGC